MKYTFSIHGVPYGSQSWGDINDSEYLKSFYNSVSATNVPTQMIVDIRYSGNAICSYYHYLILSNVDDYKSRQGSYFGMTICFEGVYCSDFVKLYKLFDECFKKVALNSVLLKSGERYKYALADFDSANNTAILKKVDTAIRNNIHLFERNLVGFPDNFSPKHREDGWVEKWAIDDVGNKTFVNILLRDSMVSISPSYPVSYKKVEILQGDNRSKDNKIKVLESDKGSLQYENEELKTRISNQEKDINSKEVTIKQQDSVINKQKGTITSLESEKIKISKTLNETRSQVEQLKEELRQAQNNRDDETLQECLVALKSIAQKRAHTDHLIDSISPRLKKAEENIEHIDNQLNNKKRFNLKSHHLLFGTLVIIAIVAIFCILYSDKGANVSGETITRTDVQTMIDDSQKLIKKDLDEIKKLIDSLNSSVSDQCTSNQSSTIVNNVDDATDYDGDEVTLIDIKDGPPVYKGREYYLIAKKGTKRNRQPLCTGGGEFIIKLPDHKEIKLTSHDGGKTVTLNVELNWTNFKIIYRYKGRDVYSRDITVSSTPDDDLYDNMSQFQSATIFIMQ